MKRLGFSIPILAAVLLMTACHDKVEPQPEPYLHDIILQGNSFQVPRGDTIHLGFTLQDAGCESKVELRVFGGEANAVKLEAVVPVSNAQTELSAETALSSQEYYAVIRDNSTMDRYEVTASLAVTGRVMTGTEETLYSERFTITPKYSTSIGTGLPVIHINTAGGAKITSKVNYISADFSIEGGDDYDDMDAVTCNIRGRGNTTWDWPKKPYLVKFDKKQSVLGLPKHKRWVLLANFMDRTMMRNIVAMKVSSMTSLAWTPRCVPAELVLNGQHMGFYLIIEQVRVDEKRINISEDNGYLLELDFHYDNEIQWIDPHGSCWGISEKGIPFGIKSPDTDVITQGQIDYIKNHIYDVAEVIYGDNFADPEEGYAKYLDVQSFADFWIVNEVMGNHELSNPGSVYFHKDDGKKIVAGPIWDFDWGILSYNTSPQAKKGLINDGAIWYARLLQDPAFKKVIKERWNVLKPKFETIPDYMEEMRKLLYPSSTINFQMWDPSEDRVSNGWQIINGDENITFDAAVDRIKTIFGERLSVMDGIIQKW